MTRRWLVLALLCCAGFSGAHGQAQPALERFTVTSAGHPITVWARRPAHQKGVIVLVHGRTWSALPDFDLQVPGESRSILAAFAQRGYAAYALDQRGYGATPGDQTGWLTPRRAVEDLNTVLTWVGSSQSTLPRPTLVGWSLGSMTSQLLAQLHPERIGALVLYGYPLDPDEKIPPGIDPTVPPREHTTAEDARSDFISPATTSQRMVNAYVAAALKSDPIRADWRSFDQWNALNPTRVKVPTLLLQGERDPSVTQAALRVLFTRLGTGDKKWVTLMGGDHAALLENTTPTFVDAIVGFIERH